MTTPPREPNLSPTLAALTELGRDRVTEASRIELDRGLGLLNARLAASRAQRRALGRYSLVGTVAVVSILVTAYFTSLARHVPITPPPQLTYRIEGGRVLDGGYLREEGPEGMAVTFSEGSTLKLTPGTRGRLRSITREGARIAVDRGTASFRITPNPARHWWIEAGPFVVSVKGTVFDVSWEPSIERFALELREGIVSVAGPVSDGTLTLRPGQQVVVNLTRSETIITDGQPAKDTVGEPEASEVRRADLALPSATTAPPLPPSALPGSAKTPSPATSVTEVRSWTQELASGHWDRILAEVNRVGIETALNRASSEDLFALADAARYRRQVDLARDALMTQRRRFPNSPRATDALFLLGRVEESRGGAATHALAWYDEYLRRAPSGGFAAEALGRKLIISKETHSTVQTRSIAEAYLRQFPKGSYAGTARAILRAP
jgi:hypothetical protein